MKKLVTIKDVAEEAGVSISTVSNALNGVDVLRPETRQHVLEVADRLQYVPNLNGRNLKAGETKTIGLFVSTMKGTYYGILADSIYSVCKQQGYELIIYISDNVNNMMDNILGRRVDGAIIFAGGLDDERAKRLLNNATPVVFLDRVLKGRRAGSIMFDSYHEGELAAQHLLECGNKSFGYMSGVPNNYDNQERLKGYKSVLRRAGYSLKDSNIWKGDYDQETACESLKRFMREGGKLPDAIFAANDESAIGTIEALTSAGIRVPEQVNVIGCDDIEMTRLMHPSVSTIHTSFEKQGTRAAEQLMRLVRQETEGTLEVLYGKAIPRESTCLRTS